MQLNKLFTSHMVFQANKPIRIFGDGTGECKISFCGNTKKVVSTTDKWITEFEPMEYGGPYELIFSTSDKEVVLEDIYVGEVYIFAGQSNVQFKYKEATKSQNEHNPGDMVRFFVCDRLEEGDLYNSDNGWLVSNDIVKQDISALGYFTACEIHRKKGVAVGGIFCYQGASVIETWLPKGKLKEVGIDIPLEEKGWSHSCQEYSAWNGEGCLYDFAFLKLVPFSVSSVIWYQGESDSKLNEAKVYDIELATLIDVWRNDLRDDDLPFVVIQLANIDCEGIDNEGWARIQKAQLDVCKMRKNVKTVICSDICETFDIHPPTKDKLAHRVAEALT